MGRTWMLALLGLLAGCRAPMPTLDTLTPYDASRVPPPSTGSYGAPAQGSKPYYPDGGEIPPGPLPGVSVGVRPTSGTSEITPQGSSNGASKLKWQSAGDGATGTTGSPAAADSPPSNSHGAREMQSGTGAAPASREAPIRVVDGSDVPREPPQLRGMPVNDASAEPGRFEPQGRLLEISQLPGQ